MSRTLSTLAVLLLAVPAFAQSSTSPAVIWHDRGDPSTLDLSSGPGGSDREPGTRLVFDARWIGDLLGRLSTTQIGDAFRSAGFSPSEVEAYTVVVARRFAALQALGGPEAARGP